MEERIDTSRFNEVMQIDSLSEKQRRAVAALRKKAGARGVSLYTLGVLDTRDMEKLSRLTDGKRLALLSPATREILIQEVRECVHPFHPAIVAVWSMWAEKNDVPCEEAPSTEQQPLAPLSLVDLPKDPPERPHPPSPETIAWGKRMVEERRQKAEAEAAPVAKDPGRTEKALEVTAELLADGKEHHHSELHAALPGIDNRIWARVRKKLGVEIRLEYHGKGRESYWRLPGAVPAEPLPKPPPVDVTLKVTPKGRPPTAALVAKLTEILADGELSFQEVEERSGVGRTRLYETASAMGVLRRYEGIKGRQGARRSFWRLPGAPPQLQAPEPEETRELQERRERRYETPVGMRDAIDADFKAFCEDWDVSWNTMARWAVGNLTKRGEIQGEDQLGDRNSEEGVELADEVFQICFPSLPIAVATRLYRANREC